MALASKLYTWPNLVGTPLPGMVCFCELGTALGAEIVGKKVIAKLDKIILVVFKPVDMMGHDG